MLTIRNVSPVGELDVPLLGRVVAAGEEVQVDNDRAERLLAQPDVWEPVGTKAKSVARQIAEAAEKLDEPSDVELEEAAHEAIEAETEAGQ